MTELYVKNGVYYKKKEQPMHVKTPQLAISYIKKIFKKLLRTFQ